MLFIVRNPNLDPMLRALLDGAGTRVEFVEKFARSSGAEEGEKIFDELVANGSIEKLEDKEASTILFHCLHEAHRIIKGYFTLGYLPDMICDKEDIVYQNYCRARECVEAIITLDSSHFNPEQTTAEEERLQFYGRNPEVEVVDEPEPDGGLKIAAE